MKMTPRGVGAGRREWVVAVGEKAGVTPPARPRRARHARLRGLYPT